MKVCACVWLLPGVLASALAGPTENAVIAAMALSESANYTWRSAMEDEAEAYAVEGMFEANGYTWVRMPMIASLARRIGRDADTQLEAFFREGRSVVRTLGGWRALTELPERAEPAISRLPPVRGHRRAAHVVSTARAGRAAAGFAHDDRGARTFRTAGVIRPHDELAIVVSTFTELAVHEDTVTGSLSEVGAALLLVRDDESDALPLAAAGTFKLWLKDGRVSRYQLRLEGVVLQGRRKLEARLRSDTVLSDVGRTRVHVPDEARWKLEQP